ncbi:AraC family transcriptional regulator [Mariniphaga sediminis]|uniref:AraC family transcriptional regulator n=1 Tax=Mariniphaga sediminis TaxID=1628158 RepID=A0A399D4X9_9BACT|nr:AraC family transcriptional regulator [Mariniphaga sediminis]RIH66965.1 AraC family transcriptional regulator [Mariniphaga sediminis]
MKVHEIRLFKEPAKSFILYHEEKPFSPWHHHPEYELVFIKKGKGKRMVGDHIDRFEENDLVFVGSDIPHEWLCDQEYYRGEDQFLGEGIVVQFSHDFLGDKFFEIPENKPLKNFLSDSSRGFEIYGQCKGHIISRMYDMLNMNDTEQLYTLFSIFKLLSATDELNPLASPAFLETFRLNSNSPMQKALQFILQNFQKQMQISDLLQITNMSYTTFYNTFKYTYRMPFKSYLMNVRIGYACRLLMDATQDISEIAYESGFENLSNFNRQFKKIKGETPSRFQEQNMVVRH